MELTIGDDLMQLHTAARPLINKGCSIVVTRERHKPIYSHATYWVSGNPYEFSAFNDRAFVFADRAEAEAFIARHRESFEKYQETRIVEWAT